jgi:hypothetical protein
MFQLLVTSHEILVQILHLLQLVLKNLSLGEPLDGNPQEFVF